MQHLAQKPMPQPEQNSPMHSLVLHAMALSPNQQGETPQHMTIKALSEHLKRLTPDLSGINKEKTQAC